MNKFWLKDQDLKGFGRGFFSVGSPALAEQPGDDGWTRARDRWEYSHVLRAALAPFALISVTLAIAL